MSLKTLTPLFLNFPCLFALVAGILAGFAIRFSGSRSKLGPLSGLLMLISSTMASRLAIAGGNAREELLPLVLTFVFFGLGTSFVLDKLFPVKTVQ